MTNSTSQHSNSRTAAVVQVLIKNRAAWMPLLSCVLSLVLSPGHARGADRPNILIIMADDCTFRDLPLYGGQNARTPNLDRLAAGGLTFQHAYLASAMCQPCRAELFTGTYPMRNGCAWNHSASRSGISSMPQHLSRLGYRVGIAGKIHVKPDSVFPFERVPGYDENCVRSPTRVHDINGVGEFVGRDRNQPFCLVVALVEPHVPWVMGDASQYPPDQLKLPPNMADTPLTRDAFSRYLAEITYMDGQVGELLQLVDELDMRHNTLVMFTSEQGAQFPGCKWTNWDTGLHTALIARWPGRIRPGTSTAALVQYADVLPTLLDVAGENAPADTFDGTSFLPVLLGKSDSHRQFVYGMHNNVPEGPPYPIRTVTNGRFRYIRNLRPDELYIEKHLMGIKDDGKLNNPYWSTWIWNSQTDEQTYKLVKRYQRRPPEELYETARDPYELQNRITDQELNSVRSELSNELDRWMRRQGDPGAEQDTLRSLQSARRGNHRFFPGD